MCILQACLTEVRRLLSGSIMVSRGRTALMPQPNLIILSYLKIEIKRNMRRFFAVIENPAIFFLDCFLRGMYPLLTILLS